MFSLTWICATAHFVVGTRTLVARKWANVICNEKREKRFQKWRNKRKLHAHKWNGIEEKNCEQQQQRRQWWEEEKKMVKNAQIKRK